MKKLLLAVAFSFIAFNASASLVGQWDFQGGSLADSQGHFGDLQLYGNAQVVDGKLDVTGSGSNPTGWAETTGTYSGPAIQSHTLVSWITLQGLQNVAYAGSAMTIDSNLTDKFDGIVFGEQQANTWSSGSSYGERTQTFNPGFQETSIGTMIEMALSYQDLGNDLMKVTGYRDGIEIGQYTTSNASSWATGEAEILFGRRHSRNGGGLDGEIEEARLYDVALTQTEIAALTPVPEPATLALFGLGLLGFGVSRRKSVK